MHNYMLNKNKQLNYKFQVYQNAYQLLQNTYCIGN